MDQIYHGGTEGPRKVGQEAGLQKRGVAGLRRPQPQIQDRKVSYDLVREGRRQVIPPGA